MQKDLQCGVKTGFSPYYKNDEICFKQRWLLTLGYKSKKNKKRIKSDKKLTIFRKSRFFVDFVL